MMAAARCHELLRAADDPEGSPGYLKALLDSMKDHGAWAAHLSVGIEQSMRDAAPFIDL
jgi:hypothetical protein